MLALFTFPPRPADATELSTCRRSLWLSVAQLLRAASLQISAKEQPLLLQLSTSDVEFFEPQPSIGWSGPEAKQARADLSRMAIEFVPDVMRV